jgi:hypothetical protein
MGGRNAVNVRPPPCSLPDGQLAVLSPISGRESVSTSSSSEGKEDSKCTSTEALGGALEAGCVREDVQADSEWTVETTKFATRKESRGGRTSAEREEREEENGGKREGEELREGEGAC